MKLKNLFADEDAVSPVIGVILMVAITVILAAVIGTFVLGLGNQVSSTTPSATFTVDYNPNANTNAGAGTDTLNITHDGGDKIPGDQLNLSVTNYDLTSGSGMIYNDDAFTQDNVISGKSYGLDRYSFSDGAATPTYPTNVDLSGATVRLLWTSESGDNSATLRKWSGPDA